MQPQVQRPWMVDVGRRFVCRGEHDRVIDCVAPSYNDFEINYFSHEDVTEIIDVMVDCPKATSVWIRLNDPSADRVAAELTGPWLYRREVALIDLLAIVYDNVENKRSNALEAMRDALLATSGLREPIIVLPRSGLRIDWRFEGVHKPPHGKIHLRAVRWRPLPP